MDARLLDGRYRLLARLDSGGMGEVWRCLDERIGREVAVKLLLDVRPSDEVLARFDREARVVGRLSCPSIVTVYDYGHSAHDGHTVPYLVMELLSGRTIARILADGTLPAVAQSTGWAVQVCDALEVAHRAGVIHRDVKPGNVMVTGTGAVKVLDFGIARFLKIEHTGSRLTATGFSVGTPDYMSPEQIAGRSLDARSDLYSLGCLLYVLLTGRPPFLVEEGATPFAVAYKHLHETPAAPSATRPGLPPELDRLVLDLLAKSPEQRPADAAAVRARLAAVRVPDPAKAEPVAAEVLETVGAVLPDRPSDSGTATSARGQTLGPAPSPPLGTPVKTMTAEEVRHEDLADPLSSTTSASALTVTRQDPSAESPFTRRRLLIAAAAIGVVGAGSATWTLTDRPAHLTTTPPITPSTTPPRALPPGSTTPRGITAATPIGQPLTGHTSWVDSAAFSPDGHTLASAGGDETVRLWNVTDPAHPVPLGQPLTGHTGTVQSVVFSPDGRTLASADGDETVRLWNVTDPAHPTALGQPLTGHTAPVYSVAFSRDGHTLASTGSDETVRLWNVTDPAHPTALGQPLTGHTAPVNSVAFSPDGHTLASAGSDNTVRLWDLTDPAHPGQSLTGHTGFVNSVAFSSDGHTLASASGDDTVRLWNVTDPAQPTPLGRPLTGHTGYVLSVAFSPDGRTLASGSADKTVRLWNVTDPAHPTPVGQPLTGHTDYVNSVAFSPDGHTLASADNDKTIRLWSLS